MHCPGRPPEVRYRGEMALLALTPTLTLIISLKLKCFICQKRLLPSCTWCTRELVANPNSTRKTLNNPIDALGTGVCHISGLCRTLTAVVFSGCTSCMDLVLLFILLSNIWIISDSTGPEPHEDYTKDRAVIRNCIKADCDCGYQPFICDVEGGQATCQPCPPGTFQAEEISSVDINDARRCKPHGNCSLS